MTPYGTRAGATGAARAPSAAMEIRADNNGAPAPASLSGPVPQPGSKLLTAAEVARLLGVPPSWVYEQSRLGRIPTVTLGRYRRYRREAIEAWIGQLEAPARGARAYTAARG
jgi:excisionase family DNA binding protein